MVFSPSTLLLSLLPVLASSTIVPLNTTTNSTDPSIYNPIRNVTTINIQISPGVLSLTNSTTNLTIAPVVERVSYYVEEGVAIIDGDVIFGTEDEILAAAVPENPVVQRSADDHVKLGRRSLSIFPYSSNSKWPGGTIYYKWESQASKDFRLADWTEGMKRWTDRLPFLRFIEASAPDSTLIAGVVTLISRTGTGSCTSPIGMSQSVGGNFIKLDDCGPGGYAHEIGHTLGLTHEQQRPDRDAYMALHCENVASDTNGVAAICGNPCAGLGCNFRINSATEADWAGAYDVLSIMHYSMYAFSATGRPTLQPLPGVPNPVAAWMPTLTDARRVCDVYWEDCRGVCGDGIFSPNNGEECDDGNNVDGDGCSADCKIEVPVCPLLSCDPTAGLNGCDVSTSCIALDGAVAAGVGQHLCACRHGFRANSASPADETVQVRLPWVGQDGRVFVKPGVQCNQLCDQWQLGQDGCGEVSEVPVCY